MIDDSVSVLLDNEPAVIETNATFSCLPGQTFSGPYRSTCMENGLWEPDPQEVKCIGERHTCLLIITSLWWDIISYTVTIIPCQYQPETVKCFLSHNLQLLQQTVVLLLLPLVVTSFPISAQLMELL